MTGQPDFYDLKLSYRPGEWLLESKALKLYLWGFRERGTFAEDLAATLPSYLAAASSPAEMTVDLMQRVRGGVGDLDGRASSFLSRVHCALLGECA